MAGEHASLSSTDLASRVPLVRLTLGALDQLTDESLAVFCFADVRPLCGAAGVVDWRLCGQISRAIERGHFGGGDGELVLLPSRARQRRRVFLFGLGGWRDCDRGRFRQAVSQAHSVLRRAGVKDIVLVAPDAPEATDVEAEFVRAVAEEPSHDVARILVGG